MFQQADYCDRCGSVRPCLCDGCAHLDETQVTAFADDFEQFVCVDCGRPRQGAPIDPEHRHAAYEEFRAMAARLRARDLDPSLDL